MEPTRMKILMRSLPMNVPFSLRFTGVLAAKSVVNIEALMYVYTNKL
jgi:hypothetical protein